MTLVAVVTAEVVHLPLFVDANLVDGKEAETGTGEWFDGCLRCASSFGQNVIAQVVPLFSGP